MKRAMGVGAAVVIGLFALGLLSVVILVKPERVKEEALARIRASSGYAVEAGPASLTFGWSGVGVRVRGVNAVAPDSSLQVSVETISAFVKLLPLVQRRVELTKLTLDRPAYVQRARRTPAESPGPSSGGAGAVAILGVDRWSIRDGSYRLSGSWGDLALERMDLDGSFRFRGSEGGAGEAAGSIAGGRLRGAMGTWPMPPIQMTAGFGVTGTMDSISVSELNVTGGAVRAAFSGGYARQPGGWAGGLTGKVDPVTWDELGPLLPPALSDSLRKVTLGGTFAVPEMRLAQGPGGQSAVEGALRLENLSAKFEGAPVGLSGFDGTLHFSREAMHLEGGQGEVAGTPIVLDLNVTGAGPRTATAHVVTSVPGATVGNLLPAAAAIALTAGTLDIDLTSTQTIPGPKVPELTGSIRISGLTGSYRTLPLDNGRGTIRFSGRRAEISDLGGSLGRSDFTVNAEIPDLLHPWADFRLSSRVLDLDELMPSEKPGTKSGRPGNSSGPAVGVPGEGTVEIATLRLKGEEIHGVRSRARIDREGVRLDDLSGTVHGGEVKGALRFAPAPGGEIWTYDGALAATGVRAGSLLAQWIPGASIVDGTLQGSMDLSGRAGGTADPRKALSLIGDIRLVDGAFGNSPALAGLGRYLNIQGLQEGRWAFRSLATHIVMRDGALELEGLELAQAGMDWQLSGRVGMDGTLGFAGTLRAEPGRIKFPDQIAFLVPYLADTDGRVPLDFKLEGPAASPRVTLDWETATERASQKLKEQEAQKLQKEIQKNVSDPETLDKLKNLLGGKKSGGE